MLLKDRRANKLLYDKFKFVFKSYMGGKTVPHSILDAIKEGLWDFEPEHVDRKQFDSTRAMPGTDEKLDILAERVALGLPLWHPSDRRDYDD